MGSGNSSSTSQLQEQNSNDVLSTSNDMLSINMGDYQGLPLGKLLFYAGTFGNKIWLFDIYNIFIKSFWSM